MSSSKGYEIIGLLQEGVLAVTGKQAGTITLQTTFADLGLDSVLLMELVCFVEERLEVRLPDEILARLGTVQDLDVALEPLVAQEV